MKTLKERVVRYYKNYVTDHFTLLVAFLILCPACLVMYCCFGWYFGINLNPCLLDVKVREQSAQMLLLLIAAQSSVFSLYCGLAVAVARYCPNHDIPPANDDEQ
jgi:hypothetical protein